MMKDANLPPLAIGRFGLRFVLRTEGRLPQAVGSMWRGLLGRELKEMSRGRKGAPRTLPSWMAPDKLYEYFIETPPPQDAAVMRLYPRAPHPFVIATPFAEGEERLPAGSIIEVPVTLFGRANQLLACVILALARAAGGGIGKTRAKAQLLGVDEIGAGGARREIFRPGAALQAVTPLILRAPTLPPSAMVEISFTSPMRLQMAGRIVKPADLAPSALLMNIVRRLSMLAAFHGDGPADVDFRTLKEVSLRTRLIERDLTWRDQHRWSGRAGRKIPLGGIMGRCRVDMSEAAPLWPWLWMGQFLHAGKGTVHGLGGLRLAVVTPLDT